MQNSNGLHYDKKYFEWQAPIGEFGGWANLSKFQKYITGGEEVLDYGCGGGYLLKRLVCKTKSGVEINNTAVKIAEENGLKVYNRTEDVPDVSFDLIISNHTLEHVMHPLKELKLLYKKLRNNGKIVFVVPCETIYTSYEAGNINYHLYSWSPMCIANLFNEAGFSVLESKPFMHKWTMKFKIFARWDCRWLFERISRLYSHLDRSNFQVRIVAEKISGEKI